MSAELDHTSTTHCDGYCSELHSHNNNLMAVKIEGTQTKESEGY
jgi:hypothetical protein